jgi:hypothetical protein
MVAMLVTGTYVTNYQDFFATRYLDINKLSYRGGKLCYAPGHGRAIEDCPVTHSMHWLTQRWLDAERNSEMRFGANADRRIAFDPNNHNANDAVFTAFPGHATWMRERKEGIPDSVGYQLHTRYPL